MGAGYADQTLNCGGGATIVLLPDTVGVGVVVVVVVTEVVGAAAACANLVIIFSLSFLSIITNICDYCCDSFEIMKMPCYISNYDYFYNKHNVRDV